MAEKPVLKYVESELTNICNLNCKGCRSFCNIVTEEKKYDLDEFTRDYKRMAELFSNIQKIRLLGGEPLLNSQLTQYVKAAREIFPKSDIRIVTNGLLLLKLDDEKMRSLKENDCKIDISNYPITRKNMPKIKARLKEFDLRYDLSFPMDYFFRNILVNPSDDPAPAFNNCIFTHCHMLSQGRLSPCSYAHTIGRLNKAYGLNYPENDYVDIYSDITGEQIIQLLETPHEFCKYCGKGMIPFKWKGHYPKSKADKNDWLVKDSFMNTSFAPFAQTVLKKPAMWLRDKIQNKT